MKTDNFDQTIFIPNNDHHIPARIMIPTHRAENEKVPAVVMLHGTGTNKDEVAGSYARLAKLLASEGIATIRIDFMGHGESTSHQKDFTFANARSDIVKATHYIQQVDSIDSERIGIMGWSQGGAHAYLAAANETGYRSVVTWAVGAQWDLSMLISPADREEAQQNGFVRVVDVDWGNNVRFMNFQWIKDVEALDIRAEVAKIDAPVLTVIGSEDFFTVEDVEKTICACKNPASRMFVIPGGNHTFRALTKDTRVFYEGANATIKWFKETL